MTNKRSGSKNDSVEWHRGDDVPMSAIRRFAREVGKRFGPEKIILFGSHAYGAPHPDSDVDILVIMPARNELDQSFKIRLAVAAPFSLDLIVRTPANIQRRLKDGDLFHTQITTHGKVLYQGRHARMDRQGRRRLSARSTGRRRKRALS